MRFLIIDWQNWYICNKKMWNLKDLDCDKMVINPNSPNLVKFIESKIPSIKKIHVEYEPRVFTKSSVYKYVLLMYDPFSDIQNMTNLDWFGKKYQAVGYSGFKYNMVGGNIEFDKKVLSMVMGTDSGIVDIICEFVSWINNNKWQYMVFLKESMNGFLRDSLGRNINKHQKSVEYLKLNSSYHEAAKDIGRVTDETDEFVSRFYYNIEKARMAIQPEEYVEQLEKDPKLTSDNPYGSQYVVENIKFSSND